MPERELESAQSLCEAEFVAHKEVIASPLELVMHLLLQYEDEISRNSVRLQVGLESKSYMIDDHSKKTRIF